MSCMCCVFLIFSFTFSVTVFAQNTGYFWHLTDIRYDSQYSLEGDIRNGCHQANVSNSTHKPNLFGEYLCDTPMQLVDSLGNFMRSVSQKADFILWTGCNFPVDQNITLSRATEAFKDIKNKLSELLSVKIYPSVSWSDCATNGSEIHYNVEHKLYSSVAKTFEGSLTKESLLQLSKSGYYSQIHENLKLLIVVLNTNCFVEERDDYLQDDPDGIWSWLHTQLQRARKESLKVYIVMSVPPGIFESGYTIPGIHWYHQTHNRKYILMVREFQDVIAGQFSGHHHTDTFRVFYNRTEHPISWLFIAPSVAPRNMQLDPEINIYSNPSARLYKFNKDTLEVLDYTQYTLSIMECDNMEVNCWNATYSFRNQYNVPNISVFSFNLLMTRFKEDAAFFQHYFRSVYSGVYSTKVCDAWCSYYHLCAMHNVDYSSFLECISGMFPEDYPKEMDDFSEETLVNEDECFLKTSYYSKLMAVGFGL